MSAELGTTNLLLGIMAAVSVLEALVIIGIGIAGFMVYKRIMALVETTTALAQGIEARQVAPAMMRVNAILDDVKGVTEKVKQETERVDHAIHSTIGNAPAPMGLTAEPTIRDAVNKLMEQLTLSILRDVSRSGRL